LSIRYVDGIKRVERISPMVAGMDKTSAFIRLEPRKGSGMEGFSEVSGTSSMERSD
jgi:hypothetical protein